MTLKLTGTAVAVLAVAAVSLSGCKSNNPTALPTAGTSATASASAAPSPSASTAADNGVAALSADQILKRAETALAAAKSFHAAGSGVQDGQKILIDVKVSGKDAIGQLTIGKMKLELLSVGGAYYMKPNEAFWLQGSGSPQKAKAMTTIVGDRWVTVPTSDKNLAGMFDLLKPQEALKPDGKVTKGTAKEVSGVPVVTLIDHSKTGGSLYIATTGEPLPIEFDGKDKSTVKFSDFGATFAEIKKPAANEAIDFAAIAGK